VTRYAFKIGDTRYGIFGTFETDDARQALWVPPKTPVMVFDLVFLLD
jgi:hypothetical protein